MEYRSIVIRKDGGVGTVVLNRPRALNALNEEMIHELLSAVKEMADEAAVKAFILTGAGRAFCFGADVSAFGPAPGPAAGKIPSELLAKAQEIVRCLAGMPKPTIAALNGFATGLGLDLALACDLRIAAERVKLGEAFVSMGLVPDGGGTFLLPRIIGYARAAEMIFTGEPVGGEEALRIGLINRLVPGAELEQTARRLAEKLANGPALAIALAKQNLRKNLTADLESALKNEAECQKICLKSADHEEAVKAFLEKRDPVFQGK